MLNPFEMASSQTGHAFSPPIFKKIFKKLRLLTTGAIDF